MKTYEIFSGEDLKIADRILLLRLNLLVHSRIYYKENNNIISDKMWDELAKELVQIQADNPEISKQVDWYDAFADWDGSTGEFLPLENEWVIQKSLQLLKGNNKATTNKPKKVESTKPTLFSIKSKTTAKPNLLNIAKSTNVVRPTDTPTQHIKKKSKLF